MMSEPIFLMLFVAYGIINISAFVYVVVDKSRAVRGSNHNRIPEAKLLFFSICFGALGVLLSMYTFRHKTKTLSFTLGVPLALIQNAFSFLFMYSFF